MKGLAACAVGLLVGCIGDAPATGEYRMEFDTLYLSDGLSLLILGLAIFAVPEIVEILRKRTSISYLRKIQVRRLSSPRKRSASCCEKRWVRRC